MRDLGWRASGEGAEPFRQVDGGTAVRILGEPLNWICQIARQEAGLAVNGRPPTPPPRPPRDPCG
jgi:hypothetical protein